MDDFAQSMLERAKLRRQRLNSHMLERTRKPLQENNMCNMEASSSVDQDPQSQTKYYKGRSGRLNQLAANINEWEDDLKHADLRRKKPEEMKPRMSSQNLPRLQDKKEKKTLEIKVTAVGVKEGGSTSKPPAPMPPVVANVQVGNKQATFAANTVENKKPESKPPSPAKVLPTKGKAPQPPTLVKIVETEVPAPETKKPEIKPVSAEKKKGPAHETSPAKKAKFAGSNKPRSPRMGISNLEPSSVLRRAALFETQTAKTQQKSVDPAELSVAERKALFEKNKGKPPVPVPILGTQAISPRMLIAKPVVAETKSSGVSDLKAKFQQNLTDATNISLEKLQRQKDMDLLKNRWNVNKKVETPISPSPVKTPVFSPKRPSAFSPVKAPVFSPKRQEAFSPVRAPASAFSPRNQASDTPSPAVFSPTPPPLPSFQTPPVFIPSSPITSPLKDSSIGYRDSPEALRVVQTIKPIVVSPPAEGSLYPNLSDIDNSFDSRNQSTDNLYLNMSFGDIIKASRERPVTPTNPTDREDEVMNEMDAVLAAAEQAFSPAKPSFVPSDSFEYTGAASTTPLVHTVSFYRKQQTSLSTPGNTVFSSPQYTSPVVKENSESENKAVRTKIDSLMVEVAAQQTVMAQASKMLSVCLANIEFSGSGEQVEGERLLLLAAHKRQACLHEAERLRVEGTLRPMGPQNEHMKDTGDIIISRMSIPLKREALHAMAADENMLYFVCLVKSGEQVVATKVVSAWGDHLSANTLMIPGSLRLEGLYSDFKAVVEVYQLVLARELLPHHVKYHLQGKKEKKDRSILTPVKKKTQSRLVMPAQSPAGPDAVRTSAFQMCGYAVFSLRELSRKQWTLSKVPYTSPLEGTLSMDLSSSLKIENEHRGFLSMFDDVSGLGAWHRRWCLLSGHNLSYWKYPDDEGKKIPLGSLDLRTIVTENVGLVSRDICARLHTFLLETIRPRTPNDVESLVLILDEDTARVRNLLSADTREDRVAWCSAINKALALIRVWNCQL